MTDIVEQLAECQAREKVLRDHFKDCECQPMLYMQSDSTALDDYVKAALPSLLKAAKQDGKREALLEAANVVGSQKYDTLLDIINELRRMAKELE